MITSSLELATPMWLWILPLPLLIYWFVPAYRTKRTAVKVPFFDLLSKTLGEEPSQGAAQLKSSWWQRIILLTSWLCVVIALAQPKMLGEPQTRESMGRDVMVAVDLSGSMSEQDFTNPDGQKINRLDATKLVLKDFVAQREGDRLGLILFGDAAFVQTPFTADHQAWLTLLDQTDVAMAGESTHLGDAIGLSIKTFEQGTKNGTPDREKVAIILTDGNDTGSFVEPIDAAKVAAAKNVRIYVIAMGDPSTVGEQALDMDVINQIAQDTGGQAFQAKDREGLKTAYDDINKLEPKLYESTTYRPKVSLQHYFISVVMILYLLAFALMTIKRIRTNRIELALSNKAEQQGEEHV
ncbi:VWA domain-containing protein [Vibrio rumoiensis]|uniref:Aerotolerance regulator BatA n=1 Tax=Vibrio rumoiensis 1S-45 TaxID=1188252 RepID=A0A1E5E2C6_9VIBR|nr:VWA domain-containing protein [Vibrio rumoiensis]OEF25582.1 aerotolerance regulator BatA [Vibrio rumoiensis 1S-45]